MVPVVLIGDRLTRQGSMPTPSVPDLFAATAVLLSGVVIARILPTGRATGLLLLSLLAQAGGLAALCLTPRAHGTPRSGCLTVMGRGARVGLDLALLRPSPGCPPGSYAPGPTADVLALSLLLAVLVLAGHVLVAALISLLVTTAAASLALVRRLTTTRLRLLLEFPRPVPAPVRAVAAIPLILGASSATPPPPLRRGPPLPA